MRHVLPCASNTETGNAAALWLGRSRAKSGSHVIKHEIISDVSEYFLISEDTLLRGSCTNCQLLISAILEEKYMHAHTSLFIQTAAEVRQTNTSSGSFLSQVKLTAALSAFLIKCICIFVGQTSKC